jgi:tetratricopeptide (TPR) repeat protein
MTPLPDHRPPEGVIAARLGRAVKAQQALGHAIARLDPSAVKIRSRLLTGLATAYVQRGKIEEACRLAIESLWIAKRTEPEPSLRALYELRRHLDSTAKANASRNFSTSKSPGERLT